MSSNESASFALDAVRKVNHRLDVIQDRLAPSSEGTNEKGTEVKALAKLEANVNAQIAQAKTLLDAKQLSDALNELRSDTTTGRSLIALRSDERGSKDEGGEVVELIAAARLTYAAYGLLLDKLIRQATQVNDQAWYWQEVEEDVVQTLKYFVQTLPSRLVNLVSVLIKRLNESTIAPLSGKRDVEVKFNRATIRKAWRLVQDSPNVAIGALFPLSIQSKKSSDRSDITTSTTSKSSNHVQLVSAARILTPLGLTRHEARTKRATLIKERDAMATQLGTLAQSLSKVELDGKMENVDAAALQREIWTRVQEMQRTTEGSNERAEVTGDFGATLQNIVVVQLSRQQARVDSLLSAAPVGLGLPSRLARLWPVLVLGPITTAVTVRVITQNWDVIVANVVDARDTIKGFFVNWVYDPCVQLLDTIRTGDQTSGVIVSPESLNSDLQSLERMVTDFSKEQYGLSGSELDNVTARVREGDLTTVLKIYERELKSPLRSAVSGSLVRALLIQIQKVKVDIAVAMRGVDQLLKSQQLLFGAIGIAPAMAILYVGGGFVRRRIDAALGQSRRTDQSTRYRAWEAMRRIDRLLSDPAVLSGDGGGGGGGGEGKDGETALPALTQGLLLLDLALLRSLAPQLVAQAAHAGGAAGKRSARGKRLRAEFLRDVRDLETTNAATTAVRDGSSTMTTTSMPGIGWHARRAAVDRMWKSWGGFMSIDQR